MQFLKTLFWVLIAVLVALFASRNWIDVTLNLWGDIQADIKLPMLLLIAFLLGFLPTWLIMRARIWAHRPPASKRSSATARPPLPAEPVGGRCRAGRMKPDLRRHRHAATSTAPRRSPRRSAAMPAA